MDYIYFDTKKIQQKLRELTTQRNALRNAVYGVKQKLEIVEFQMQFYAELLECKSLIGAGCLKPYWERRSGNTTRLADYYIQQLFEFKEVEVIDHHSGDSRSTRIANDCLMNVIAKRLWYEHKIKPERIIQTERGSKITIK